MSGQSCRSCQHGMAVFKALCGWCRVQQTRLRVLCDRSVPEAGRLLLLGDGFVLMFAIAHRLLQSTSLALAIAIKKHN